MLWVDVCQRAVDYFQAKVAVANYGSRMKPSTASQYVYRKFMEAFEAIAAGKGEVFMLFLRSILRGSAPMLPGTGSSQIP